MMTQADILAENQETYKGVSLTGHKSTSSSSQQQQQKEISHGEYNGIETDTDSPTHLPSRPASFGFADFPAITSPRMNEQSPIRPSKYFATDSAINASKGLRKLIICGIIFSLLVTVALIIQIAIGPNQVPNRIGIITQESVCSEIGADMVRQGGNSVDAFIASALCMGVVNPFVAGFGA